jgi:peroxiredoxin/glutaredoxin
VQIPGYLSKESDLKAKGVAEVIVYCCNDGAVMKAWGQNQGVEGSIITFMADTQGDLTKALGAEMTADGPISVLGAPRCKRHALYVEDGSIKAFEIAEAPDDPAGDDKPDVTLVENMLTKIPDLSAEEREAALAKVAEEEQVDIQGVIKAVATDDLVMFVKPGCPFCKAAKEALDGAGFTPTIITATASDKKALAKITGRTTLPSAWVKGEFLGGCDDGVKPAVASGDLKAKMR